MKATLVAISCLFAFSNAWAAETWETCLDQGDFSYNADISFVKSAKVVKTGCLFRFTETSAKGLKLEVNVCDPITKILRYAALDSGDAEKVYAGSAGCPAPLFGADIDLTPGASSDYEPTKERVWDIFNGVKKKVGSENPKLDVTKLKSATDAGGDAKLACAELLLQQYLGDCVSFTPKEKETGKESAPAPSLPKGVHPAVIK